MSFEKYRILLWKNWTIQKRHYKSGIFEVIFPVLLVILFTAIKSRIRYGESSVSTYTDQSSASVSDCWIYGGLPSRIVYSPISPWIDEFVHSALETDSTLEFEAFEDSKALDEFLLAMPSTTIGIEFDDSLINSTSHPNILSFTLRYPENPDPYYQSSFPYCFDTMQNTLEKAFISIFNEANLPGIYLTSFQYYIAPQDEFTLMLSFVLPIVLIFTTFYTVTKIIKNVAIERETQLKESMMIMGLSNKLHWSAWLTSSFLILLLAYTLVTIFLTIEIVSGEALFKYSNIFLIWIFFIFYVTTVITFCFLMSVIFKKAATAAKVGSILYFITYVFYYQFGHNFASFNYIVKLFFCLPVNTGLGQGVSMILDLELNRVGLQFSNFASHDNNLKFSIIEVLFAFLIASIIHMLLTSYIEQVFTGSIGIAKPWYFPFLRLTKLFKKPKADDQHEIKEQPTLPSDNFEADPQQMKAGIKIVDITKRFGKSTVVNQFTLNMYEDQITVLLGHNGCGKSTTINMLTGMFAPTSGTAFLNDHDIRTDIDEARKSLGLCPQHNVLFEDLTVREHLIFFCRLKGVTSKEEIDIEISKYVDLLDLNDKINALSKTLSGGQKRKLSIGVALCGNSKIVMLDEPTSGLDAGARRALWNLLIEQKKGRTILLTTHHMDEADILGDRIAIMNNGELQTVGSSFFLKKRFGSGYKLICVKNQGCNPKHILKVLQEFVPDVSLDSDAKTEAIFIINEDCLPMFTKMFRKIEEQSESLKISSFGFSLTTLEEVFIKVGSDVNKSSSDHQYQNLQFNDFVPTRKVKGLTLILYQMYAIMLTKFHFTRRNFYPITWLAVITAAWMYIFLVAPIEYSSSYDYGPAAPQNVSLSSVNATVTGVSHDGSNTNFFENYFNLFEGKDIVEEVKNFEDYIFDKYQTSVSVEMVNERYLLGLSINSNNVTAYYQYSRLSSFLRALNLNLVNRAILKTVAGIEFDFVVANKLFYYSFDYEDTTESTSTSEQTPPTEEISKEDELSFGAALINFCLIFAMFYLLFSYWPSMFIAIKVKERITRAKLLQFISGVNRYTYWLTSFIVDYIMLLVIMYIIVGIVALNQRAYFRTGEQLGTLIGIFSLYGFSAIPFIYVASFIFVKHATAESMIFVYGLICAVIYLVYILFEYLLKIDALAATIYWIMLLFAPFSLFDCFWKITLSSLAYKFGDIGINPDYGIEVNIIMMIVSGIFFMSICLLLDHMIFEKLIHKIKSKRQNLPTKNSIDDDVKEETEKVKNMTNSEIQNGNLVLQGLSKFYSSNLAVDQLYLCVNSSECFGLLGINGAGKTSTFKMMTGDEVISSGDVWIHGKSMQNNMIAAQESIGYCPQFDALMFDISGRENLKIFSLIRGIPRNEIDEIIDKVAHEFGFYMHLDKKIKVYSGGNKRKISTALSLLGDPNLIFLDEPTTGIDPYSKRQLWTIINKTRNSGKSVILTSHSMEECEALCTRIAIMVAGEFKCLGSAQHLKNKFAKGFILTIKMKQDNELQLLQIKNRVNELLPLAQLKEKYMDLLTFHMTSTILKWSEVFETMSQLKSEIAINDFTVTQMSLEQVFLHFTKEGQSENEINEV